MKIRSLILQNRNRLRWVPIHRHYHRIHVGSNRANRRFYPSKLVHKTLQSKEASPIVHSPFAPYSDTKIVLYHVFIGMCAASFWRGAWYVLDDVLFPNQKELSAISSLTVGTAGMFLFQGRIERIEVWTLNLFNQRKNNDQWMSIRTIQRVHSVLRVSAIYSLVLSVVCIWRGTWMCCDIAYEKCYKHYAVNATESKSSELPEETALTSLKKTCDALNHVKATDPGHALQSGLMSHCTALLILSSLGIVACTFAPPAAISIIRDRNIYSHKTSIERILYRNQNIAQIFGSPQPRRTKFTPRWWRQR
jgi:Fuseless